MEKDTSFFFFFSEMPKDLPSMFSAVMMMMMMLIEAKRGLQRKVSMSLNPAHFYFIVVEQLINSPYCIQLKFEVLKISLYSPAVNTKQILHTALIWSAKYFALQPC